MSERIVRRKLSAAATPSRRGQSLVEFGLILPFLMVMFLGIADFGRVFQAGIVVEAAARDGAEIVAEEYRRNPPAPLSEPAPPGDPVYYQPLHELGAMTVCSEMRILPSTTYDPNTGECHVADSDPDTYDWMPVILVCIHDGEDPLCDDPAFGATIPDPECSALLAPISPAMEGVTEDSRYVEVRICYRFTTLMSVPILSLGDVWLQRDRAFTVAEYPVPTPSVPPEPPPPDPTALPTPEPTPEPSPTPTPEETPTPTPTATPEDSPTPTPTPIPTPIPTPVETASPTPNPNDSTPQP